MANNLTRNPLYLDTTGGTSYYAIPGTIGSILFSGNTDTDSTVLLYNAENMVLANRSFEKWGNGAALAPDGWTVSGASAAVAREGTIIKDGSYSAKLTRAGTNCYLSQNVLAMAPAPKNAITWWQGKNIMAGAWVYATVGDRAYLETYDGQTTTTSGAHAGNSAWAWLTTAAADVHASATQLTVRLAVKTGDTAAYIDSPILFETIPLFYLLGQDKPYGISYPRPLPFRGLYLATLTGGAVQVQI
ncbi:MAG: hypothetical protein C4542_04395 [Dehalococcoidia bacterium]|nr:MAG: hypothetical protein C4542_04395 [Dehalococcoidia bacterium]